MFSCTSVVSSQMSSQCFRAQLIAEGKRTTNTSQMPDDILAIVLRVTLYTKSLFSKLSLVSKSWYHQVDQVCIDYLNTQRIELSEVPGLNDKYQQIDFFNCHQNDLTSLTVKHFDIDKNFDFIRKLINLTTLSSFNCCLSSDFANSLLELKNLTKLELNNVEFAEMIKFFIMIAQLNNLSTIVIDNCSQINDDVLRPLASLNLSSLTIRSAKLSNGFKGRYLDAFKQVKKLNLSYTSIPPRSLEQIGQLINLSQLNLTHCIKIVTDLKFLKSIKKLTSLNLSYCTIKNNSLKNITSLKNLTSIKLNNCIKVNIKGICQIAKMTNLVLLHLSGCNRIKREDFFLLHSLKKLSKLCLPKSEILSSTNLYEFIRPQELAAFQNQDYDMLTGIDLIKKAHSTVINESVNALISYSFPQIESITDLIQCLYERYYNFIQLNKYKDAEFEQEFLKTVGVVNFFLETMNALLRINSPIIQDAMRYPHYFLVELRALVPENHSLVSYGLTINSKGFTLLTHHGVKIILEQFYPSMRNN